MTAIWLAIGSIIGGLAGVAIGDLVSEEVRGRLDRFPAALIRLAGRRLPRKVRAYWTKEWLAELQWVLRGDEALPITRLIHGTHYAVSLLVRGARGVGREDVQTDQTEQDAQQLEESLQSSVRRAADGYSLAWIHRSGFV
jgi:hypothetical protein